MKLLILLVLLTSCVSAKKYNTLVRKVKCSGYFPVREYQFNIDRDSLYLYDGWDYLGGVHWKDICKLDSVIIEHNQ